MQILRGKVNSASVFADDIEGEAVAQIHRFLDHPAFAGGRIAIMPDVHAGAGAVIGFTAELGPRIVPNVVGVDIGCGVTAWRIPDPGRLHFDRFDAFLRKHVPSGFDVRDSIYPSLSLLYGDAEIPVFNEFLNRLGDAILRLWPDITIAARDEKRARVVNSIGTLGGGNHFIELDRGDDGSVWLTIHSGSRNFGLQIATHHQKIAVDKCGKHGGLEWLEGADRDAYIADMRLAQAYARLNRTAMAHALLDFFDVDLIEQAVETISSVHNYIDFADGVIRKGAISARQGETVIIPLTMADGCVLGRGRGNIEWNCSAPHGAGRVMSRSKAKATIDPDAYAKRMREANVWSSCVGKDTLDEAPMAYRRPKRLLETLGDTVEVEQTMRPVYNFKAGGS